MEAQKRLVLHLEYNGTSFSGSQKQLNVCTVQGTLEKAFETLGLGQVKTCFSGRTDRGVHAKGQVVHADIDVSWFENIIDIKQALNAVLPETMSIKDYQLTELGQFHSLLTAKWRWYRYKLFLNPYRSVWMEPDAVRISQPLDIEKMQEAAQVILGEHDFSSFQCVGTIVGTHVCKVHQAEFNMQGEYLIFDIVANRFLYKMVRTLMGTLIEIGQCDTYKGDKKNAKDMLHILNQQQREAAGPTAPPDGLSLMAVYYPSPWGFFQTMFMLKH